jgi:hypothetical protein
MTRLANPQRSFALLLFVACLSLSVATLGAIPGNSNPQAPFVRNPSGVTIPAFYIPLTVNENGYISYGLLFGVNQLATKGLDTSLGEREYPPFCPPGCPMAMIVAPFGNAVLDIRPYVSSAQIDTYTVAFQKSDDWGFPFTFSWPNLSPYYSGPVRLKSDITGSHFDIDMKAQTSFTDTNTSVGIVYIIAQGPIYPGALPTVSTVGLSNNGLTSIVNPNGNVTDAWFEYGTTTGYGTPTSHHSVSGANGREVDESISLGSLPNNTRFHVRGVASNINGTFYGPDRIFSTGIPAAEVVDTTKYRTATYRQWADAVDKKGKRKSLKPKPDKVDYQFNLKAPDTAKSLILTFSMYCSGTIHKDSTSLFSWDSVKKTTYTPGALIDSGSILTFQGRGFKGGRIKVKFTWLSDGKKPVKGSVPDSSYVYNIPRLPMPNLHNVGEDVYGGVMQTPVQLTVGATTDPAGSHTVVLPKYKDALKSMVKEAKGGAVYHQPPPRCLNTFDKSGNEILKPQKGLPPDKHNNILFADQLVLKLNVAASDSGIFPPGFGDLIYDNVSDPTPFDGMSIRTIVAKIDSFLGCNSTPLGVSDSSVYWRIAANLDTAFSGPMDTVSWSEGMVVCTGVRQVSDVSYLHAAANATPVVIGTRLHEWAHYVPSTFRLDQNYPNPFNPTTVIGFQLAEDAVVTLKVYNILGQELTTLVNHETMDEGSQEVEFNAANLPSGVYFYRLVATGVGDPEEGIAGKTFISVKKMTLVR